MRFSNVFFLINRNTYSTHGNSLKQHEPNIFIIPNYIDKKKEKNLKLTTTRGGKDKKSSSLSIV